MIKEIEMNLAKRVTSPNRKGTREYTGVRNCLEVANPALHLRCWFKSGRHVLPKRAGP